MTHVLDDALRDGRDYITRIDAKQLDDGIARYRLARADDLSRAFVRGLLLRSRLHGDWSFNVACSVFLGGSFRNESSKDVAFPHQQTCKDHEREEDKSSRESVQGKFFKRTIDIAVYRDREDDVNPAKDPTQGALVHDSLLFDDDAIRAR